MPKRQRHYPDGQLRAEEYTDDVGNLHRVRLPAATLYHPNGKVAFRVWYDHGKISRTGGLPAWISYDEQGKPMLKKHYVKGVLIK
jgi:antitoxin component YwqK of YwqJK toxin-antitoxin module